MKAAFVLNSEASRWDLVSDLLGQINELEGSLHAMGVAVHGDGITEPAVLATQRQIRSISQLAEVVTTDKAAAEKREAAEAGRKHRENYVKPYFDQETGEAKRAQLEEFITDDDIAAEFSQLKHNKRSWAYMAKQDAIRLKLIDELKAKRADANTEASS